jgi:Dolichyl-phosphate-mannose-protein mannosyltransferase
MADTVSLPSWSQGAGRTSGKAWWVLLGAVLLPLVYLGTLTTRFDFIDDGNLVYPTRGLSPGERVGVVWGKIVANYEHLGPFRPVLWCHWEVAADLLGGNEFAWRLTRLAWCGLATLMLLWLMAELRMSPVAALAAAAIATWNPYRNEIWTSLTLSEGVAMPYALLALVCACRAPRGRHPAAWDVLGATCVLAALGCKNTFAALVPAQVFLRLAPDDLPLREGWRRHGRRALLLGLTLAAPLAHYLYFKLNWHPGQYTTDGATPAQLRRILSGLVGAISADFMGLGLALAVFAQLVVCRRAAAQRGALGEWLGGLVAQHRAALGAGALLLAGGIVLYLPLGAMSGRYSMPAVWGLDLTIAAVLSGLGRLRPSHWTRAAWGALALGLVVVMAASVGKQQKFAARAQLLWEALEYVEREAPPNAEVAWISGDSLKDGLNVEEGIHFQWHLAARGRRDVRIGLYDDHGEPLHRCELAPLDGPPTLAISAGPGSAADGDWRVRERFVALYWSGLRRSECYCLATPRPALALSHP